MGLPCSAATGGNDGAPCEVSSPHRATISAPLVGRARAFTLSTPLQRGYGQLHAKNLSISAVRRTLSLVFFFHNRLSLRHLHPVVNGDLNL
jgi:hypothetical protein